MIHRDLKPSNLLLKHESFSRRRAPTAGWSSGALPAGERLNTSDATVKILDVGLARLNVADGFEQTELTHTGQIVGTPDYISPEQACDSKSADARSDVYSLGCTLFRLLFGRVPIEGDGTPARLMARSRLTSRSPADRCCRRGFSPG